MRSERRFCRRSILSDEGVFPPLFFFLILIASFSTQFSNIACAATVTTTIAITICGDANVGFGEVCDDGVLNLGGYGSTTATRQCLPSCNGFGPYCGDNILQALYSEECDDGNAVNGDLCSDMCLQESPPTSTTTPPVPPPAPSGGGGGGGAFGGNIPIRAQTRVILEGKAYPNTQINILKDGILVGVASTDSEANFSYEMSSVSPGPTTFGFWALDGKGVRSITYTTTFQITQNALTTVSNIFLPPTISLDPKQVGIGDLLSALGSAAPFAKISIFIDKERDPRIVATSTGSGVWSMKFPVEGLSDEAFHAARAVSEFLSSGATARSGFSQAVSFYVGTRARGSFGIGDLNGDGKVNLVDFSLFLFHWNTDHAIADLNQDGRVNLADFSILLANWTG